MAVAPVVSRGSIRAVFRQASQYGDVLPSLSTPASRSAAGDLPSLPSFYLLGFRSGSRGHAGVVDAGASSCAPARHVGRAGLSAILPSSTVHGLDMSIPSFGSSVYGGSGRLGLFLGVSAGVTLYSMEDWDGFLHSKKPGDDANGNGKPPTVPPSGISGGVGGGPGGCGCDHDRYLLLLKLLLELCESDDGEESKNNFQCLKQLMQREWFELHKLREELNARKVVVGAEEELVRVERKNVEAFLARVTELHRAVQKREAEVSAKGAADALKLKEDRADLDRQLREAGLDRQKIEDMLFRARLDENTVREMWKALEAEQAREAAAGSSAGNDGGKGAKGGAAKEGQQTGGTAEEEASNLSGFWSTVWAVVDTPKRAFAAYCWSADTYWTLLVAGGFFNRAMALDEQTLKDLETKIGEKHEANVQEVEVILDDFGLPPKK